jgi:tellurite resistance protein TerC
MTANIWMWAGFNVFVLLMLALDLGLFHKNAHEIKFKEAMGWTVVWVSLALIFNLGLYFWQGPVPATEFLTGYLIEKSLSVDNIFVFILIFAAMKVPKLYQHKVLFWGILGALVLRAVFIFSGIALIQKFHWIIYVFGALLIFTGIKMAFPKKEEFDPEKSLTLKILGRIMPMTTQGNEGQFFGRKAGKLAATPLFAALVLVEISDLIFAVDSIPAILAITEDPFIVYTSNVFAILGLRSLYFALAHVAGLFHYIGYGLSAVLIFVGAKMLAVDYYKISPFISLAVIGSFIGLSILASVIWPKTEEQQEDKDG